MKNLVFIFVLISSLGLTAQTKNSEMRNSKKELKANLTPEQSAEILSKKLTLHLDLSIPQEKQVKQLFLDRERNKPTNSKSKKEMNPEERFEFKKAHLDRQIELKSELKKILSSEQFEKWEKIVAKRKSHQRRALKEKRKRLTPN